LVADSTTHKLSFENSGALVRLRECQLSNAINVQMWSVHRLLPFMSLSSTINVAPTVQLIFAVCHLIMTKWKIKATICVMCNM
jgi:hypothetical protein